MMKCAKCNATFALVTTVGNTKTYCCTCPRDIVESSQADPIEARLKALEAKVDPNKTVM